MLTLKGVSDRGASRFNLVLSSSAPITTGLYSSGHFDNHLDSLTFRSPQLLWNGNSTYLNSIFYGDPTLVRIDSIDGTRVAGRLEGQIWTVFGPNGISGSGLSSGRFRAEF